MILLKTFTHKAYKPVFLKLLGPPWRAIRPAMAGLRNDGIREKVDGIRENEYSGR